MSTKYPLPAGTALGKSFEYGIDVNLAPVGQPKNWQSARRISAVAPTPTPKSFDAQSYDDEGADNSEVTGWGWGLGFSIQVNRNIATGAYLPEVEALLARTRPTAVGELAIIEVRWYHKPSVGAPNPLDAYQGFATVSYTRQNTGPGGEIELLAMTLTGKGPAAQIVNPYVAATAVAVLTDVYPAIEPIGGLVQINGSNLAGATGVKFGTISAVEFVVSGAGTIYAVVPATTPASAPITVITPAGTSAALPFRTVA